LSNALARRELSRQLFHIVLGITLLVILLYFGRLKTIYFLSGVLFVGFLLINLVIRGIKVPIATWFVETFERKDAALPGYGSAWYVIGLLISCLLIPNLSQLAAAIVVFAFGDAASTIFGRRGHSPSFLQFQKNNRRNLCVLHLFSFELYFCGVVCSSACPFCSVGRVSSPRNR